MKQTTNPAETETQRGAATAAATAATTTTWVKRNDGRLSVFTNLDGHRQQQQQPPFSPTTRQQRNSGPVDLDESFSVSNRSRNQFLPITKQDVQQHPPFSPATREQRNRGPVDLDESFSVSNRSRKQFLPITEQDIAGVEMKKEPNLIEENRNDDEGRSDNIITKFLAGSNCTERRELGDEEEDNKEDVEDNRMSSSPLFPCSVPILSSTVKPNNTSVDVSSSMRAARTAYTNCSGGLFRIPEEPNPNTTPNEDTNTEDQNRNENTHANPKHAASEDATAAPPDTRDLSVHATRTAYNSCRSTLWRGFVSVDNARKTQAPVSPPVSPPVSNTNTSTELSLRAQRTIGHTCIGGGFGTGTNTTTNNNTVFEYYDNNQEHAIISAAKAIDKVWNYSLDGLHTLLCCGDLNPNVPAKRNINTIPREEEEDDTAAPLPTGVSATPNTEAMAREEKLSTKDFVGMATETCTTAVTRCQLESLEVCNNLRDKITSTQEHFHCTDTQNKEAQALQRHLLQEQDEDETKKMTAVARCQLKSMEVCNILREKMTSTQEQLHCTDTQNKEAQALQRHLLQEQEEDETKKIVAVTTPTIPTSTHGLSSSIELRKQDRNIGPIIVDVLDSTHWRSVTVTKRHPNHGPIDLDVSFVDGDDDTTVIGSGSNHTNRGSICIRPTPIPNGTVLRLHSDRQRKSGPVDLDHSFLDDDTTIGSYHPRDFIAVPMSPVSSPPLIILHNTDIDAKNHTRDGIDEEKLIVSSPPGDGKEEEVGEEEGIEAPNDENLMFPRCRTVDIEDEDDNDYDGDVGSTAKMRSSSPPSNYPLPVLASLKNNDDEEEKKDNTKNDDCRRTADRGGISTEKQKASSVATGAKSRSSISARAGKFWKKSISRKFGKIASTKIPEKSMKNTEENYDDNDMRPGEPKTMTRHNELQEASDISCNERKKSTKKDAKREDEETIAPNEQQDGGKSASVPTLLPNLLQQQQQQKQTKSVVGESSDAQQQNHQPVSQNELLRSIQPKDKDSVEEQYVDDFNHAGIIARQKKHDGDDVPEIPDLMLKDDDAIIPSVTTNIESSTNNDGFMANMRTEFGTILSGLFMMRIAHEHTSHHDRSIPIDDDNDIELDAVVLNVNSVDDKEGEKDEFPSASQLIDENIIAVPIPVEVASSIKKEPSIEKKTNIKNSVLRINRLKVSIPKWKNNIDTKIICDDRGNPLDRTIENESLRILQDLNSTRQCYNELVTKDCRKLSLLDDDDSNIENYSDNQIVPNIIGGGEKYGDTDCIILSFDGNKYDSSDDPPSIAATSGSTASSVEQQEDSSPILTRNVDTSIGEKSRPVLRSVTTEMILPKNDNTSIDKKHRPVLRSKTTKTNGYSKQIVYVAKDKNCDKGKHSSSGKKIAKKDGKDENVSEKERNHLAKSATETPVAASPSPSKMLKKKNEKHHKHDGLSSINMKKNYTGEDVIPTKSSDTGNIIRKTDRDDLTKEALRDEVIRLEIELKDFHRSGLNRKKIEGLDKEKLRLKNHRIMTLEERLIVEVNKRDEIRKEIDAEKKKAKRMEREIKLRKKEIKQKGKNLLHQIAEFNKKNEYIREVQKMQQQQQKQQQQKQQHKTFSVPSKAKVSLPAAADDENMKSLSTRAVWSPPRTVSVPSTTNSDRKKCIKINIKSRNDDGKVNDNDRRRDDDSCDENNIDNEDASDMHSIEAAVTSDSDINSTVDCGCYDDDCEWHLTKRYENLVQPDKKYNNDGTHIIYSSNKRQDVEAAVLGLPALPAPPPPRRQVSAGQFNL